MGQEHLPNNSILSRYVSGGKVDYDKLREDPWVENQIAYIRGADVCDLPKDERLAFWLNAYNLTTIKAVLEKTRDNPQWRGVTSIFQKFLFFIWNRHMIAGKKMSLYHLENRIIRKFGEPRIHFALNCASGSCPYLPQSLFEPEELDAYLDELTHDFINNQGGAALRGDKLWLSRIFKMYRGDFGENDGDLISFVKRYWQGDWTEPQAIRYQPYDWSLNSM